MKARTILIAIIYQGIFIISHVQAYQIVLNPKQKELLKTNCLLCNKGWNNKTIIIDTATIDIIKGAFIFSKPLDLAFGVYYISHPDFLIEQIISQETITINLDIRNTNNIAQSNDTEHELYTIYRRKIIDFKKEINDLKSRIQKANEPNEKSKLQELFVQKNEHAKSWKNNFLKQHHSRLATSIIKSYSLPNNGKVKKTNLNEIDFNHPSILLFPGFLEKAQLFVEQSALQPDTAISNIQWLLNKSKTNKPLNEFLLLSLIEQFDGDLYPQSDKIYAALCEYQYLDYLRKKGDTLNALIIQKRLERMKPLFYGKPCPELNLADFDGEKQSIYSINKPYTLLVFYDSDCDHCSSLLDSLLTWIKIENNAAEIGIYSVDLTANTTKNNNILHQKKHKLASGILWKNVFGENESAKIFQKFNFKTVPTLFLLDTNKKIIYKNKPLKDILLEVKKIQKY